MAVRGRQRNLSLSKDVIGCIDEVTEDSCRSVLTPISAPAAVKTEATLRILCKSVQIAL